MPKRDNGLEFNAALQPKQMDLLKAVRSGARYPFYGGAKGGGKSYASRVIMLVQLLENPGTTGLLIRRTFKQVSGNHIRPLFREFPQFKNWYNKSEGILYLPNGSELMFGHCEHEDDVFQYAGQEFDYIAVEEVTQFTEFMWQILSQSNRSSNAGVKPTMWATGNPGGIGHLWVKRLWVDRSFESGESPDNYSFISAKVQDNPALTNADPTYVNVLKNMKDEALRRAYLNGDWDIYPGQFFTNWNREEVVVAPYTIPTSWPLFGGLDYGEASPTSFGLYTVDFDGNIVRIAGYYLANATASRHAENVRAMVDNCPFTDGRAPIAIYADPSMWVRRRLTEASSHSAADVFREHDLMLQKANNDRVTGWRICKDALGNQKFTVFEGWNDDFIRTVPALPRDDKNWEDIDTHAEDHAADEWRYAMVHIFKPAMPRFEFAGYSGADLIEEARQSGYSNYGRYS